MRLNVDAYIEVGKEEPDYMLKDITVQHDLTKADLEEFVKEQQFSSVKQYFMYYIDQGSKEDNEKYYKEFIEPFVDKNCDLLETEIIVTCGDKKALYDFIENKYKQKINRRILMKLEDLEIVDVEF